MRKNATLRFRAGSVGPASSAWIAKLYASAIDGFLFKYFPQVDAEAVVNETLAALVEELPLYEYDPTRH